MYVWIGIANKFRPIHFTRRWYRKPKFLLLLPKFHLHYGFFKIFRLFLSFFTNLTSRSVTRTFYLDAWKPVELQRVTSLRLTQQKTVRDFALIFRIYTRKQQFELTTNRQIMHCLFLCNFNLLLSSLSFLYFLVSTFNL
jgi:hypothetical protein